MRNAMPKGKTIAANRKFTALTANATSTPKALTTMEHTICIPRIVSGSRQRVGCRIRNAQVRRDVQRRPHAGIREAAHRGEVMHVVIRLHRRRGASRGRTNTNRPTATPTAKYATARAASSRRSARLPEPSTAPFLRAASRTKPQAAIDSTTTGIPTEKTVDRTPMKKYATPKMEYAKIEKRGAQDSAANPLMPRALQAKKPGPYSTAAPVRTAKQKSTTCELPCHPAASRRKYGI